jgi:hypothetical protein
MEIVTLHTHCRRSRTTCMPASPTVYRASASAAPTGAPAVGFRRWWSGMSRESPGAQMVPSGVSIQNPQQSSGLKMWSLAPGDSFYQAWSAGVTSTFSGPMVKC